MIGMDQAAIWLGASILIMLGLICIVVCAVVINNIFSNYWKPITIFTRDSFSLFASHHNNVNDPFANITDEEYNKLAKHLDKLRTDAAKVVKV
jgi:cell division protein FtsL